MKKPAGPPSPLAPRGARRNKGSTDYNAPLDDAARALIWTLTEEGKSARAIADELGISPSSVSKALGSDPVALESLRQRMREARSGRWKEIETLALDETIAWIGALRGVRVKIERAGDRGVSERAWRSLTAMPRALACLRHAGESATRMVQLLTGGATERMGHEKDTDETSADQLVAMAIDAGLVEQLPPRLKEYAKELQAKGKP